MKKSKNEDKEKPNIKNPHNNFTIKLFEHTKNGKRYALEKIPKEITKDFDWRTFKPAKVSFIDEHLKGVISDIVYTVKWKGLEVYVSVVIEHQSSKPIIPHLKMIRYLVNGYDFQIEQIAIGKNKGAIKKGKLPKLNVIIPIYLYHGKEDWEYQPFQDFFNHTNEHLIDFIPNFKYILDNLTTTSNEELFENKNLGILSSAFLLLKNYRDKDYIISYSAKIIGLAQELSDGSTYFQFYARIALSYLASASKIEGEDINQIVKQVDNETVKKEMMNFIEEFELKGKLEGKREGKIEERTKITRNLIIKFPKYPNKEIAEMLGVTTRFVSKVRRGMRETEF